MHLLVTWKVRERRFAVLTPRGFQMIHRLEPLLLPGIRAIRAVTSLATAILALVPSAARRRAPVAQIGASGSGPTARPERQITAAAMLMLGVPGLAQEWLGFDRCTAPCFVAELSGWSRNGLGVGGGEVMTRIDGDEHTGWGNSGQIPPFGPPATRQISGVKFIMFDAGLSVETYDINFYSEGFPPNNPLVGLCSGAPPAVPFCIGCPGTGAGLFCVTVTGGCVGVPVTPAAPDIFLSFTLPAAPWPLDGLAIGVTTPNLFPMESGVPLTFDTPGPRLIVPFGLPFDYSLVRLAGCTPAPVYVSSRQHLFDIQHCAFGIGAIGTTYPFYAGAGGVGLTWNTQPGPVGNAAWTGAVPGTANFFSGTHPNVTGIFGPPGNGEPPGRCDIVGMEMHMTVPPLGVGHLVFFCATIGGIGYPFGPEVTIPTAWFPGGTGVVCLDISTMIVVSLTVPAGNCVETRFSVPCSPTLFGLDLQQQAFALDTSIDLFLHASPCDRMRL
ncbi:MAG: hypothetical protein IPK26_03665 [Planctomycetes bacterium]|nr:hypothetical protein [Planctomycetota bacterium]